MLSKQDSNRIVEAIRQAERFTSAEVRVCIAKSCKTNPLDAARLKFKALRMDTTRQHNSVLIFVAPKDHKTAIVGDSGIYEATNENFWDEVLQEMLSYFRESRICEGICKGVERVGNLMKVRYPVLENDVNELSDDIVVDED